MFLDYDGTLTPIVNRPEDAFEVLSGRGITCFVGDLDRETAAKYHLRGSSEVEEFLFQVAEVVRQKRE